MSEQADGEGVFNRLFNVAARARQELAARNDDSSLLSTTRRLFFRQVYQVRGGSGGRRKNPIWQAKLFLLSGPDNGVLPPTKELEKLSKIGLEGECSPVTLEKVLEFTSDASTQPPLGFPHHPQIQFLYEGNRIFPEANTCALVLRLPLHSSYEAFKQYMMEGILQAPTFGLA